MYHHTNIHRKIAGISGIAIVMAGLLYAYDLRAADIHRGINAATRALSPVRMLKEHGIRSAFERGGPVPQREAGTWKSVPVFVYHGITNKADRFNMTEKTFQDQMFALKRAGYETVSLREFHAFIMGETNLPAKSFLLTFDDGRVDSYAGADPILKTLGYSAVMFVASGASMTDKDVRWSYYLSPNDIKDMLESGRWEIGSHAVQAEGGYVPISKDGAKANFLSSRMWLEAERRLETEEEYAVRVGHELGDSKRVLQDAFVQEIEAFSYPFGDYGQQSKNHSEAVSTISRLTSHHYRFAFRQVWPKDGEYSFNDAGADPHRLKRIETPTDWSGAQLVAFLEAAREKALPFQDDFKEGAGWQETWGIARPADGGLALASTATSTGAAAFLEGTAAWKDYGYSVRFDLLKGSHVSLMARYEDARTYLTCTFGEGHVQIERVVDGNAEKLAKVETGTALPAVGASVGMRVRGASVECLVDTNPVVSATGTEGTGGVGVRIWDKQLNNASALVRRAAVTPLP